MTGRVEVFSQQSPSEDAKDETVLSWAEVCRDVAERNEAAEQKKL
jgi:hypothetical protein